MIKHDKICLKFGTLGKIMTHTQHSTLHFPRAELAQQVADDLLGKVAFSDARNGLFIAAPRRTGKSKFLQQDLKPALEKEGVLVVYVDLWSDKKRAPMDLIASALADAVTASLGWVGSTANKAGLKSFTIPGTGFVFDASKIGKIDGMTLPQALVMLREQSKKPIALIIDEAQHALISQDGDTAMSALKSARDQMRDAYEPKGEVGLILVMSGSHRDKLMRLLDTPNTPFWGSKVQRLPSLGAPYVAHVCKQLIRVQPALKNLNAEALHPAFLACNEEPQAFDNLIQLTLAMHSSEPKSESKLEPEDEQVLGARKTQWNGDSSEFIRRLTELSSHMKTMQFSAITAQFEALPSPQRAILTRLFDMGKQYKAFDTQALAYYEKHCGEKLSAVKVQRVLESLMVSEPPWVWRSLRGDYALYDQTAQAWYQDYVKNVENESEF